MDLPVLYTVAEAAAKLQIKERWYLKRLRDRQLPGHKVGRNWRVTEDDMRAAVESMAVPAIVPVPDPAGLTPTSRRRVNARRW